MSDDHRPWMRPASDSDAPGSDTRTTTTTGRSAPPATSDAPSLPIRAASLEMPGAVEDSRSGSAPVAATGAAAAARRRWLLPAAVAVAATIAVGLVVSRSGDDTAPAASDPSAATSVHGPAESRGDRRIRLVGDLLKRRVAALRAGDQAGWLADLDSADTPSITFEKTRFANLRRLAPTSFDLRLGQFRSGMFATTQQTSVRVTINQIAQLAADIERSAYAYDWTVAFDGDQIRISDITPSTEPSLYKEPLTNPPFDMVPLRTATSSGVTVLAATTGRWDPKAYLPAAQRAAKLVRSLWGRRPHAVPGFVIFLADHQQFGAWYDNGTGRGAAVGVTVFPQVVEADGTGRLARPNPTVMHKPNEPSWIQRGAGARIVLDMSQLDGTRQAQTVMAHEMAHAIGPHLIQAVHADFGPKGTSNQATWPIEGFARWVEFLDQPGYATSAMRAVRAGRATYHPAGPFPASDNFYAANPRRQSFNYNLSSSMFLAAEQAGGRQKAVDLYICLTNQMEYMAETEMFINTCISGVGLDPTKVWALHKRLTT